MSDLSWAEDPLLVIDNGGHTATPRSILFTNDSRFLVSAGDDKVIRVWDVRTGKVETTIRGQIGLGAEGQIYATALSPDNKILAAAGRLTGKSNAEMGAIRLHSFPDGEVIGLLEGAQNITECLAFSPDGRFLASGSSDFSVRIWDVSQKHLLRTIPGNARVHSVAFSNDSTSLAWGSQDGFVGQWSMAQNRIVHSYTNAGNKIVSVAFTPNGRYLLAEDDAARIHIWDTATGVPAGDPIRGGDPAAQVPANLSITPDGKGLLVTSRLGSNFIATVLDFPAGTPRVRFTRHNELIQATAISPDGRISATAGGDNCEIYLWETSTGVPLRKLSGGGAAIWSVAFSKDGTAVAFGTTKYAQQKVNDLGPLDHVIRLRVEQERYRISSDGDIAGFEPFPIAEEGAGVSVAIDQNPSVLNVNKGSTRVAQIIRDETSGYRHKCYTLTRDGQFVISGALNGVLTLHSARDGRKLTEFVGHTGAVWSIGLSPDGRTLVSGSDDQTVRLWDVKSGRNLLCFFLGQNRDWVAWTPEGYYASSLNGDKYVGWQINRGNREEAKYYSVARFQKTYYRPDVVAEELKGRDITAALHAANERRGRPDQETVAKPSDIAGALPPVVYVAEPDDNITVESDSITVKGVALSSTLPISTVKVLVDGLLAHEYKPNLKRQDIDFPVKLPKGSHVVTVVAANAQSVSEPVVRKVTSTAGPAPGRPNLIFLAIGISKYREAGISLRFADKDAQDLEALMLRQKNGRLFANVETKVLPNEKATREEILNAIDWLRTEGTPNDVRVLFLAGHGELGPTNSYFFCSFDHKPGENPELHGVRWIALLDALRSGKGRAILMIDTCHASAVSGTRGLTPVDLTEVIKEANRDMAYTGITYYTASAGTEYSLESPDWGHGAFTKALIEGISGKAAPSGDVIQSFDLGAWVSKRVAVLTKEQQHAGFFSEPATIPSFPIFAVVP